LLQAFLANHSALFQRPTLPKTAWPLSGPQLQRKSTLAPSCTFEWGEACPALFLMQQCLMGRYTKPIRRPCRAKGYLVTATY
jgi:hypothetical protein